jgi:ribosomal protein S7
MPDALDASRYEVPVAVLIDAIGSTETANKRVRLGSVQQRAVEALESRRVELNTLYERAVAPDTGWQQITQVAAIIGEWGRAAAEKLHPQIDALQRKLADPGNDMPLEVREARQQSIEVAEGWLALYCDYREMLLRLAAERRPADVVLHANPVQGEVDHAALSREFIARFPKLRAALAK